MKILLTGSTGYIGKRLLPVLVEAYPRREALASETSFKGPLELYKRYDFKINKEYDDYYLMRKKINTMYNNQAFVPYTVPGMNTVLPYDLPVYKPLITCKK